MLGTTLSSYSIMVCAAYTDEHCPPTPAGGGVSEDHCFLDLPPQP